MQVVNLPDGRYAIREGPNEIVLDKDPYEDIASAVPIDNGTLYMLINDGIMETAEERAVLQRIVDQLGGVEAAMTALQKQVQEAAAGPPAEEPAAPLPAKTGKPAPSPKPAATPRATYSILLVEPADWTAKSFREILDGTEFVLAERVAKLDEAFASLRRQKVDFVLFDLATDGAQELTRGGRSAPVRKFLDLDGDCRVVLLYARELKSMLMPGIRAGASGHIPLPCDKAAALGALTSALTSRKRGNTLNTLVAVRTLACSWREGRGFFGSWENFLARSLDPNGVEAIRGVKMKEGTAGRLQVQLPADKKPLELKAKVEWCKWDSSVNNGTVRFQFVEAPPEATARLNAFLNESQKKPPAR